MRTKENKKLLIINRMKTNKEYFKELVKRLQQGDYKKIIVNKGERKGFQVKFGYGVSLTVNTTEGRAFIALFDNEEIDIDELTQIIQEERNRRTSDMDREVVFSSFNRKEKKQSFFGILFGR